MDQPEIEIIQKLYIYIYIYIYSNVMLTNVKYHVTFRYTRYFSTRVNLTDTGVQLFSKYIRRHVKLIEYAANVRSIFYIIFF